MGKLLRTVCKILSAQLSAMGFFFKNTKPRIWASFIFAQMINFILFSSVIIFNAVLKYALKICLEKLGKNGDFTHSKESLELSKLT